MMIHKWVLFTLVYRDVSEHVFTSAVETSVIGFFLSFFDLLSLILLGT